MIEKLLYTRKEAGQALSVSVRMVDYLIKHGKLKPTRIKSSVKIHIDELNRFSKGDHPNA